MVSGVEQPDDGQRCDWLKWMSLMVLVVQNAALFLIMRFATVAHPDDQPQHCRCRRDRAHEASHLLCLDGCRAREWSCGSAPRTVDEQALTSRADTAGALLHGPEQLALRRGLVPLGVRLASAHADESAVDGRLRKSPHAHEVLGA